MKNKIVLAFWLLMYIPVTIINIVISLLAFPLAPIIALFSVVVGEDNIPKVFWPWLTYDNPIDGDSGHLERWPSQSTFKVFCRRTGWLWRNKGYNAAYYWFGKNLKGEIIRHGNRYVSDNRVNPGLSFEYDHNGTWELYYVRPYDQGDNTDLEGLYRGLLDVPVKKRIGEGKGIRIRLGWKIPEQIKPDGSNSRVMHAFSFNFYKTMVPKDKDY